MKYLKYNILFAALLILFYACTKDTDGSATVDNEVSVCFRVSAPAVSTRAVAESQINQVDVLVFEDTGSGLMFDYAVQGYSLAPSTGLYDYEFLARIVPGPNAMRFYVVANARNTLGSLTRGMTEQQVRNSLTTGYFSAGFTDVLPMSGVVDLPTGLGVGTTLNSVLLRSAARIDVVNNAANFQLTSVRVYRANNLAQVIPNTVVNNSVTTASVPASSQQGVNTVPYNVVSNSLTQQIYVPESALPAPGDRRLGATAVVVGGVFGNGGDTTYYRMDFIPEDDNGEPDETLFGQVLRNHLYRFEIQDVLAAGWNTPEEASLYPSTDITADIVVWDEETMDMVFDDYNYIGVSRREVLLSYLSGDEQTVLVTTNLDSYQAYWGNEDGTIEDGALPIALGENRDDPDGFYNAELTADGTTILFTSLQVYDPDTTEPRYLVLFAGRLRIVITVMQGTPSYGTSIVSIFGSTREIGNYGLYSPYEGWSANPGDRTRGLTIMLNGPFLGTYTNAGSQNFGPGMTVDMGGFNVSGAQLQTSMPRYYYDAFDVLYLTYDCYVTAEQATSILDWVDSDPSHVLIVQFDSPVTNPLVLNALGLTRIGGTTAEAFSYTAASVPDYVKYGPFGSLTFDFSYQCKDATYGAIDPTAAQSAGFQPLLLSNGTGGVGNYVMSVNADRRIILCGDCDIYGNNVTDFPALNTGSYYLSITNVSLESATIDRSNPAHVFMGNLWAWITDIVLGE